MSIKVGDRIPNVSLKYMDKDGMQVNATLVDEIYKDGKLVPYTAGSGS